MKKILTIFAGIVLASFCYSEKSECAYPTIDTKTEQEWIASVNDLLDRYYPFKDEAFSFDYQSTLEKNLSGQEIIETSFMVSSIYYREQSKDPAITNIYCKIELYFPDDYQGFDLKPAHTNLSCFALLKLAALETGNVLTAKYVPQDYQLRYEIIANQQVDPTVKTPVESGNEQGTAGHP